MNAMATTGARKIPPRNRKKTLTREWPRPPENPGGKGPPRRQEPPHRNAKSRDNPQEVFSGQQILEITDEQIEFVRKRKPSVDVYIDNIRRPEFSGSLLNIIKADEKIVVQLSGSKQPGKEKETKIPVTKSIMIKLPALPNKEVGI